MILKNRKIKKESLKKIQLEIKKQTKIMAVTKTLSNKAIDSAIENNIYLIGENKIQETEKKIKNYNNRKKVKIHLIGHLQSNKTKKAVKIYDIIETVSSLKILNKINNEALKINKKQNIYIQINIGKDKNKQGFLEKEVKEICIEAKTKKNINNKGLMTILPNKIKKEEQQALYGKMKKIQTKIEKEIDKQCKDLSMGMSGDYQVASKEGSTQIRIGTLLYGKR